MICRFMIYDWESRGLMVQRLSGMQEVLGSNLRRGNNFCSPSPSEETLNRGPYIPIPRMIYLRGIKRSWLSIEGDSVIIGVEIEYIN